MSTGGLVHTAGTSQAFANSSSESKDLLHLTDVSTEEVLTSADFRRKFTIDDLEKLYELGFIDEVERYELIDGDLIPMSRILGPHASCINHLNMRIPERLGNRGTCLVQNPIFISDTSQPQPDFAIAYRREDGYLVHARPNELYLVIEVMDLSGQKDRRVKVPLYAVAGIRETWLVDIPGLFIEQHRNPVDGVFSERLIIRPGQVIAPEAFPDLVLQVSDILGLPEGESTT
jgi:Uma2 family endonuclease